MLPKISFARDIQSQIITIHLHLQPHKEFHLREHRKLKNEYSPFEFLELTPLGALSN